MQIIDDLNNAIATEKQQFADYKASVEAQLAAKDTQITDLTNENVGLKEQLANAVTPDTLAPIITGIGEIVP